MWALGTHLVLGTATIYAPGIVTQFAQQDAWLAVLLAGMFLAAGGTLLPLLTLAAPGKGLLRALEERTTWLARPVALVYGLFLLHLEALVTDEVSTLWQQATMAQTPATFFIVTVGLLAAGAARAGLETISRVATLVAATLIVLTPLMVILGLNMIHFDEFRPVLATGWEPVLAASQPATGFFNEVLLLALIWGNMGDVRAASRNRGQRFWQAYRNVLLIVLTTTLISLVVTGVVIAAFGPREVTRMLIPTLEYLRVIRLGEFLQRLESGTLFFWTWSIFVKAAILHFLACEAWAVTFGLRDAKVVSLTLLGPLVFLALSLTRDPVHFQNYIMVWGFVSFPFEVLLLAVSLFFIWLLQGRVRPPESRPAPSDHPRKVARP